MYNHSKLRQIGWTLPLLGYLFFTHVTAATTYYVSTTGKANSTGTKERPTNSLQSALEQIERQSGQGSTTDFHIVIQPGTYRIEKAICIGPQHVPHGGSLTIKAETPGTVDISGARAISEWKQTDQRNVWTAKDQVTTPRQGAARQLFLAEKRGIRAREPDRGFFRVKRAGEDRRKSFTANDQAWRHCRTIPAQHAPDVEVALLHDWSMSRVRVKSLENQTVILADRIGGPHKFFRIDGFEEHPRYFFENAKQFLDAEYEFFFAPHEQRWYLYSKASDPNQMSIEQPTLPTLLHIQGTIDDPVQRVTLEGLNFQYTTCPLPVRGYAGIQAAHYEHRDPARSHKSDTAHEEGRPSLPPAISVKFAMDCAIRRCGMQHLGGAGIHVHERTSNISIECCELQDIGANGIMIGETNDHKSATQVARGITVSDCNISRCGQILLGSVGIWVGFARDSQLVANEISDLPYTGISVGWRWDDTLTNCRNNQVLENHIHHVMQVLSDGGGIYTLGRQPGTKLLKNRIHNIPINAGRAHSNGIFMDEGSADMVVAENTIFDIDRSPMRFHRCQSNEIRENHLSVRESVAPFTFHAMDASLIRLRNNDILTNSPPDNPKSTPTTAF